MLGKCERRLWKQQEHGGYGIPEWLAGSKRVQVKGGMLLLAAYPWKTPTGKAVREIWFEYFWKRRSKEWCWIFESGRILEERFCEYLVRRERWGAKMRKSVLGFILKKLY